MIKKRILLISKHFLPNVGGTEIYNKNGRTACADLEAQLSTLFTLNLKCFDIPTEGEIDHIKAFARIETRANASLLKDEKFYTKEEVQISVPFRRPYVKEAYVKRVLELIGGENNEERS